MNDLVADTVLVDRAKAGDYGAFEELVTRHERGVYSMAMNILRQREDAEDVVQTAFLQAFEHLSRFRGEAAFGTWVRRIAVNGALKVIRKHKRGRPISLDRSTRDADNPVPHPEFIAEWRDPGEAMDRRQLKVALDKALGALPDTQRVVFVLRDMESMSVKETARTVGISEVNVKVRLLRARLALREKLTRAFGDESRRLPASHEQTQGQRATSARSILRSYQSTPPRRTKR